MFKATLLSTLDLAQQMQIKGFRRPQSRGFCLLVATPEAADGPASSGPSGCRTVSGVRFLLPKLVRLASICAVVVVDFERRDC
jgi:hypothetical protein